MNIVYLISFPFVQRAVLAGIIVAALLAFLGVFVVLRKISFFSDGIAHASLAGVAIGVLFSWQPIVWAIVFSIIFAIVIYWLEEKTKISSDALIGILFTSSLALGVFLMSFKSGYQPELLSFLFGNILTINWIDVWLIIAIAFVFGIFMVVNYKKYLLLSLNKDFAYLAGINIKKYGVLFYIILAVSIVLGIKMVGVILVSALTIIPVSVGKLFAPSFKWLVLISLLTSELMILSGIGFSLMLNLPTGASIVIVGALLFFVSVIVSRLLNRGYNI
jgi:ABC-type Mn2+/Zn2+ transport system permease subunit